MRSQNMTVLVVGSGAREHILAQKLEMSSRVGNVLCSPGNGGFRSGQLRKVKEADLDGIIQLAKDEHVDLVVVGPEVPLVKGLVDQLAEHKIDAFGPTAQMAQLEGSKAFTKRLCRDYNIPTAPFHVAETMHDALHFIRLFASPPVIKADGLCAGKGVVVAKTYEHAIDAAEDMLVKRIHGEAGDIIVIEERLMGRECSVMAFCDGETVVLLPPARDYKRAHEGDEGPNTGGMGSFSPLPDVDDALMERIKNEIFLPALRGFLEQEGLHYHGLLYAGLMLTSDGPKLIEFNVRFGDPEVQVILTRTKSDIVDYMLATLEVGGLAQLPPLEVHSEAAVCVVLASDGYPGKYETGMWVAGDKHPFENACVFHAGTEPLSFVTKTKGGRVMSVVGVGSTIELARQHAYDAAAHIYYDNKYLRTDIAQGVE
jgi:phosphoribosylamine--glycine ligase